jgi:hypothetical protein
LDWFRCWNDIIDDPKLLRLTPAHRWVWMAVMVLANKSPRRGSLYVSERMPCNFDDLVRASRESPEVVQEALGHFESDTYGMLGKDDAGAWVVLNFQKRNPSRDDSSARMTKMREQQRNAPVTRSETQMKRAERVTSDAAVTRPDLDTDTDTEEQAAARPRPTQTARSWWEALDQFAGRPISQRERDGFNEAQDAHGLDDALIVAVLADVKEKAKTRRFDRPLVIAIRDLADLGITGVRTVADWDEHKKAKSQATQRPATGSAPPRASPTAERQAQGMATLARLRAEAIAEEEAGD